MLSGCATTGTRRDLACSALPPVNVDPSRIIRTVAGLRPYRASGFVVRRDPFGDKTVVHNYGHGGAGITLSWGSSRLATNLGLPGHSGPVAVIGAGVMGLTTARLVQEAGFPVTIYTAALSPDTTSNVAGGQISPFGHFSEDAVTPEWRAQFAAAMAYSWSRFQLMAGDKYGVRWLPTYEESRRTEPTAYESFMPDWRVLSRGDHPFDLENVVRYRTMYVETPRFLRQLTADVLGAGGRILLRRFATPADLGGLAGKTGVQLHRHRRAATCSATRNFIPFAASSPCCSRSRRCFTPRPAAGGTCSLGSTASCSAGRSSGTCGTRRPSRRPSTGSSGRIATSSAASAAPLEVVRSAPNLAEDELPNLHSPERRDT